MLALALCLAPHTASAYPESMATLAALSQLLGSEEACGLAYSQDAVAAFVKERVDPQDAGFTGSLNLVSRGVASQVKAMTGSQRTAHCTAIAQTAKAYGFTE